MKKISVICLAGVLFFAACENTNSSTVGTYEKDETTESVEKSGMESHHSESGEHMQPGAAAHDNDSMHTKMGTEMMNGATQDSTHHNNTEKH